MKNKTILWIIIGIILIWIWGWIYFYLGMGINNNKIRFNKDQIEHLHRPWWCEVYPDPVPNVPKREETEWENDWKHIVYYKNGYIKETWEYEDWKKIWKRTLYYGDDNAIANATGNASGGFNIISVLPHFEYEGGHVYERWMYKNWEKDWERKSYYYSGQLKEKSNYKNGQLDWKRISYYENGQTKEKWNYQNGQLDWERISYYENSQI